MKNKKTPVQVKNSDKNPPYKKKTKLEKINSLKKLVKLLRSKKIKRFNAIEITK